MSPWRLPEKDLNHLKTQFTTLVEAIEGKDQELVELTEKYERLKGAFESLIVEAGDRKPHKNADFENVFISYWRNLAGL